MTLLSDQPKDRVSTTLEVLQAYAGGGLLGAMTYSAIFGALLGFDTSSLGISFAAANIGGALSLLMFYTHKNRY